MKVLKITLWVCAFAFLVQFLAVPLPWDVINDFMAWMGTEPLEPAPFTVFGVRLSLSMFAIGGVFFLFLARNPLGYGAMLPLAACGLLCYGIFWMIGGIGYGLPTWSYVIEGTLGIGGGALILIFEKSARRTLPPPGEREPKSATK